MSDGLDEHERIGLKYFEVEEEAPGNFVCSASLLSPGFEVPEKDA